MIACWKAHSFICSSELPRGGSRAFFLSDSFMKQQLRHKIFSSSLVWVYWSYRSEAVCFWIARTLDKSLVFSELLLEAKFGANILSWIWIFELLWMFVLVDLEPYLSWTWIFELLWTFVLVDLEPLLSLTLVFKLPVLWIFEPMVDIEVLVVPTSALPCIFETCFDLLGATIITLDCILICNWAKAASSAFLLLILVLQCWIKI